METWFLAPTLAIVCGVIALAPLGVQVLARGVVFIDLAVAQAAAAAALWAVTFIEHPGLLQTQALAACGALSCVTIVALLARRWPAQREALIGLIYVAGACLAMLGARADPHGRERLTELLAADVLWASWPQAAMIGGCAALMLLLQIFAPRALRRDVWFYLCFALLASIAVPVLGLFVVFACLIAPALWQAAGRSSSAGAAIAIGAALCGLALSWWIDLPSGACVALALSLSGAFAALGSRRPGGREPAR